jgi:hypothetical protein
MKKLFLIPLMILALAACAGQTITPTTTTAAPIVSAQIAAQDSLYATGVALQATPKVMDALYQAGKMSKAEYNSVVPVYNRVQTSYKLAVAALDTEISAGRNPNTATAYLDALQTLTTNKTNIDNLLTAYGQAPVGAGVAK